MDEDKGQNNELSKHIVNGIPLLAYYIPNFISEDEEKDILHCVNSAPLPKWTQLSHRRLQNWGGIPHLKGMIPEEIPPWLKKYINKVGSLNVFPENKTPNHVLVNEYLPCQGIMPHSDGPLFHPIVTTISCGSHTILDFYKRLETEEIQPSKREFSLLLEPRSLLILQKELYHNYLHAIDEKRSDTITKADIKNFNLCSKSYTDGEIIERTTRLSLTIRHVPKTSKFMLKLSK